MNRGIYTIKNLIDGRAYVGSSVNITERIKHHRWALNNNRHPNGFLQKSWNKHGETSFEFSVLEMLNGEQNLIEREEYYVDLYQTMQNQNGYNILRPAEVFTEGIIQKMTESRRKRKMKPLSEETKKKLSAAARGKVKSQQHRENLSKSHKGKKKSKEHVAKVAQAQKGKIFSEEHKQKISAATKGVKKSEETKRNMREAQRKRREREA